MAKEPEVVAVVEAEIVDAFPAENAFGIMVVDKSDIPEDAVPAPSPERLLRNGLFHKGARGKKRIYETPEQMEKACVDYFTSLMISTLNEATGQMEYSWRVPPTIPGLARALGMEARTLRLYNTRDEFHPVVEWAKDVIRENLETGVQQGGNQGGRMFLMKNLGYSDNINYTFTPPDRLEAAKTIEEIAEQIDEDIV